jgi:hypothetical protein
MIENCPGAVGGAAPDFSEWGYVDVQQTKQYEAIQYLNHRGVKYLTPDYSPVQRCVRLKFKGGIQTGLVQRMADNDPNERIYTIEERWREHAQYVKEHPTWARRLGCRFGRRKSPLTRRSFLSLTALDVGRSARNQKAAASASTAGDRGRAACRPGPGRRSPRIPTGPGPVGRQSRRARAAWHRAGTGCRRPRAGSA